MRLLGADSVLGTQGQDFTAPAFRGSVLKLWSQGPFKGPRGQNYFHNNPETLLAVFPVLVFATDGAKAALGASPGVCANSCVFLSPCTAGREGKSRREKASCTKNVLDGPVEIISFIKSLP